jgi:hypothetical protein
MDKVGAARDRSDPPGEASVATFGVQSDRLGRFLAQPAGSRRGGFGNRVAKVDLNGALR